MGRKAKMSRLGYSQFLLSSQTNYTLTYFAAHVANVSHDAINRYLLKEKLTPSMLWEHSKKDIIDSSVGYWICDDTVLDKTGSKAIELARWQYSGNAGEVIQGIGVVTCVYYNPEVERYWSSDYRIYSPEQDGKSKIDPVDDMLRGAIYQKQLPFQTVLMDTWYATNRLMQFVQDLKKTFYCAIKSNRLVSRPHQTYSDIALKDLHWSEDEKANGICLHLNKTRQNFHVQCFRIVVSTHRTDYVVTNDLSQFNTRLCKKRMACVG